MMQFKTLKFAGIAALATTLFTACSEENHAGVLTETESGTTIASLVKDENGKPVASAKVNLISATHIAARMAPIKTTTTDEEGKYTIDSISAGEYALQISNTEHTQSAYQTLTIEENNTDLQTLTIPEAKLEKNASLELGLNTYDLGKGDTLCITGTLNCASVGDNDVNTGIVTIRDIPPMEFTKIMLIKGASHDTTTRNVKWDFVPGEKLEVESTTISITIPDDALEAAKQLNAPQALDSLIVPVTLSTRAKNPALLSSKGDTLPLYKVENDKNSSRYLTVLPSVKAGTDKFTVISSDSAISSKFITKAFAEAEKGKVIKGNEYHDAFSFGGNGMGISFWIDGAQSKTAQDTILRSLDNDRVFTLETSKDTKMICANIYLRESKDTVNFSNYFYTRKESYCHDVLDGNRHHYLIFIYNNHIIVSLDGSIVNDTDTKFAFSTIPGIAVGSRNLEDLTVFSVGSSLIKNPDYGWERLHAWFSAYYIMQK